MNAKRIFTVLLFLVYAAVQLLAQETDVIDLYDFSWGKNQFGMHVPEGCEIVQETDSMFHAVFENMEIYVVVEDRSIVTEESCAQYIFDDVKRKNGSFATEPVYTLKERSVSTSYVGLYPHEDLGECVMAESCMIDRMSRRIFTIAVFATHQYDSVITDIITSPFILPEPYQY